MNSERDHRRWRADLAAYLLGALEDDEREVVEDHLEECEACRDELRWLRPAIDLLPESVAQLDPPPQLRERLLAEVSTDAAVASSTARSSESERSAPAGRTRGFRSFLLRPAVALAGVALLAAAVAGYSLHDEGGSDEGGSHTKTVSAGGFGKLQATLERKGDSGTLQMTGLHQAPPKHVYEAWVQRGDKVRPASLFDARHNGAASVALQHSLGGADLVMVTVEPRGGSHQPTSPPLVNLRLRG